MSGDAGSTFRHSFKRKRADDNYASDIFRSLAPQFEQRRFGVPDEAVRTKLHAALNEIEHYGSDDRDSSSGDEPEVVPPPPQVSRITMGGVTEFSEEDVFARSVLARHSKNTMTNLPQSVRNSLRMHKPVQHFIAKTRSDVRRERHDLFRRLAEEVSAKHHVLYDHHDHREYDRDISRGIRGRGMVTASQIDVPQSEHSSDSWSSSSTEGGELSTSGDDSLSDTLQNAKDQCFTKTSRAEAPREKWVGKYLAHHHHHRRDKYQHPKDILRQKLQYVLNHSVRQARISAGSHARPSKEEVKVPNWIVNQIWSTRKYQPLYRLKRNFKLLSIAPTHHQHHLHVHGHKPLQRPKHWQPEDHLEHRYDTLSEMGPSGTNDGSLDLDHKVPHRLEEQMPPYGLHRHTHSMTNVVTHLLHADKKFEHLYNPSIKAPLVRIGKAMVPLNEDLIRRTSAVMNDPGFKELLKDPDESALVIAKVIQDAAKNGLVETIKTMDSAPEVILGSSWVRRSFDPSQQSSKAEEFGPKDIPVPVKFPSADSEQDAEVTQEIAGPKKIFVPAEGRRITSNTAPETIDNNSFRFSNDKDSQQQHLTSGEASSFVQQSRVEQDHPSYMSAKFSATISPNNVVLGQKSNARNNTSVNQTRGTVLIEQEKRASFLSRNISQAQHFELDKEEVVETNSSEAPHETVDAKPHLSVKSQNDTETTDKPKDNHQHEESEVVKTIVSDYSLGFMQQRPMKFQEPAKPSGRSNWVETEETKADTILRSEETAGPIPLATPSQDTTKPSDEMTAIIRTQKENLPSNGVNTTERRRASRQPRTQPKLTNPQNVPTDVLADVGFRSEFSGVKVELDVRRRLRTISAISAFMQTNNSFSEIIQRRILLQQRKQQQLDAQIRKVQYQALPPVAEIKKKKKAKKQKKKAKRRRNIKKPKRGALAAQPQVPAKETTDSSSPPPGSFAVSRKQKVNSRRKCSLFQTVAVTRDKGRNSFFVPLPVINRTQALEKRYERLRRLFEGVTDRGLSECVTSSRSFGSSAESKPVADAKMETYRKDLKNFVEEPSGDRDAGDTWKCIRTWLKYLPSDAEAYTRRASFEKIRDPQQAIQNTAISLGVEDRLSSADSGAAFLRRALCYVRMGPNHYDFAMGDLRTSVMLIGFTPQSALAFACYSFVKKQYFRAIAYFALALTILPVEEGTRTVRFSAFRALAILLFRTQQYRMAYEIWVEASNICMSTDASFFLFSGVCLRRMGEHQKSEEYLRSYLAEAGGSRTERLSTIYCNILLDRIPEASRCLEQLDPLELLFDPKILMICARLFWTVGEFQHSAECVRQCRQIRRFVHPAVQGICCDNQTLTFMDILENVRAQSYDCAYQLCLKGRSRWRNDLRFITWLAFLKFNQTLRWTKKPWAVVVIEKLSKHFPNNHFIWYAQARCAYYNESDHRKTLTCLTRAIRLAPKFYEAYFFRAALKAKLGRLASAMKDSRLCCNVFPKRALCWAAYGYFAVLAHRYETALSSFLLTLELKRRSKFNWLLVTRGWLFYMWEMFSHAFDDFRILLRRNPGNPHLIKALALTDWPFRGRPYVTQLLQRYEVVLHENPTLWLLYGLSLFDQADPSSYIRTCLVLQQIVKCYPVHPLTRLNLGVCLWWSGEPASARVMFEVLHESKEYMDSDLEEEQDETLTDELLRIHAYAGLGITLFATSHHVRALGILEAIANSGFADAYFFLAFGFIRLAMKKPREAGNAFSKACYLEKFNMEIKFLIGGIYLLFSSARKAIDFYEVIIKERDRTFAAPALLNRAVAQAQLNCIPKALKDLQIVQRLYPEFSKRYRLQIDSLDFQLRVKARKQRTEEYKGNGFER